MQIGRSSRDDVIFYYSSADSNKILLFKNYQTIKFENVVQNDITVFRRRDRFWLIATVITVIIN